jgi:hypothetical protein
MTQAKGATTDLRARLERWAGHFTRVRFVAIACALAASPVLLSIFANFVADDHVQFAMMRQGVRPAWDLFHFVSGVPSQTLAMIERGEAPWFVAPELHHAFLRPLASLSHWFDYRFFGPRAALAHVHNLIWFGLLSVAVACVYRRFENGKWTAGLAALVFVSSPGVAMSACWLAARNTLMAAAFGVAALGLHHHARQAGHSGNGARRARVGAFCLFVAALASSQAAAGSLVYLLAYAVAYEKGGVFSRALSVAPYALFAGAWWWAERALGYGVAAFPIYSDLNQSPLALAAVVIERLPHLLAFEFGWGHVAVLAGRPEVLLGGGAAPPIVLAILVLLMVALLATASLKDRSIRFWFLAGLGSMLPFCLTLAQPRLLVVPHIGMSLALARCLALLGGDLPDGKTVRCWWALAAPALTTGISGMIALGSFSIPFAVFFVHQIAIVEQAARRSFDGHANKDVVVLSATPFVAGVGRLAQEEQGTPQVRSTVTLAEAAVFQIERPDPRTLVFSSPFGLLGAQSALIGVRRFRRGDRVRVPRCTIEVLEAHPAVGPTRLRYEFDVVLEDPSLVWFTTRLGVLAPIQPPRAGTRLTVVGDHVFP